MLSTKEAGEFGSDIAAEFVSILPSLLGESVCFALIESPPEISGDCSGEVDKNPWLFPLRKYLY